MAPKKKNIVDQLRRAIADCGESEYAIAKGSGVSQSVVNRFVSGDRGISLETAAKLCEHLKLELVPRGK
jgi:predicted transcriptional regulator